MKGTILVLTNNINGIYNFRKEVMNAIVDKGYRVVISIPEDSDTSKYLRKIGCEIVQTKFAPRSMNPIAEFKLMLAYRKLIKQMKPVAVLTYTIKPNIYGGIACRLTGTPQIANITGLGDSIENGGWLQKITVFLYRFGVRKAKQVFFQNKENRDRCIKYGISNEQSVLLPGSGVNLQHHSYQTYPKDEGKTRFLFIGRLLKDKGIDEYFETAKAIRTKYPNTEFQILGKVDGSFQPRLDELTKSGVVHHLGKTIDVRPFICAVHCTIMPSYHEGMSNVNLESASNGRPVITTDIPGCRETVDDGMTGYLAEPKNAKSLMSAVEKFLALSYEQKRAMGIAARRKVEKEFDRNIVVKAYLDEIDSISGK